MEVSEQQLSLADQLVFRCDRFFHFHYHLGCGIRLFHSGQDLRSCGYICLVRKTTVLSCGVLYVYSMSAFH